jgi:hypothetical protein
MGALPKKAKEEFFMQDQDFEYFLKNTEQFYKEYGHKYLAIKEQKIIGVYDTFNEALDMTLQKESLGTFLIQECLEKRENAVFHFQGNVRTAPLTEQLVG